MTFHAADMVARSMVEYGSGIAQATLNLPSLLAAPKLGLTAEDAEKKKKREARFAESTKPPLAALDTRAARFAEITQPPLSAQEKRAARFAESAQPPVPAKNQHTQSPVSPQDKRVARFAESTQTVTASVGSDFGQLAKVATNETPPQ